MNIGEGLKKQMQPGDLDNASLMRGLKDTLAGNKTLLTVDEAVAALAQLQKTVQLEENAAMQQASEANMKAGDAFLAANKTKEGVVTLPSGLQYKIISEGKDRSLRPPILSYVITAARPLTARSSTARTSAASPPASP